jgi:hypothetical protein
MATARLATDIWATSGNGWMNEVLVPIHDRCEMFRAAIQRTARGLIQNTYSPENSCHLPNPERARGGSGSDSAGDLLRSATVALQLGRALDQFDELGLQTIRVTTLGGAGEGGDVGRPPAVQILAAAQGLPKFDS